MGQALAKKTRPGQKTPGVCFKMAGDYWATGVRMKPWVSLLNVPKPTIWPELLMPVAEVMDQPVELSSACRSNTWPSRQSANREMLTFPVLGSLTPLVPRTWPRLLIFVHCEPPHFTRLL